MIKNFPDTSTMSLSEDGSEFIRGGSIGLNRILQTWVDISRIDRHPRFHLICLSAFTIFRNVYGMIKDDKLSNLEDLFVKDINLFMEYFDTYLSHVSHNSFTHLKYIPVLIYFPDYRHVSKDLIRELSDQKQLLFKEYERFRAKHGYDSKLALTKEFSKCFFISVGQSDYPHKDLSKAIKTFGIQKDSFYVTGDPVALMSHMVIDYHLTHRLRNLFVIESYTGKIKSNSDFKLRLDKEGRIPFSSALHLTLGDDHYLKNQISRKEKQLIFEKASSERWLSSSEENIIRRLEKLTSLKMSFFIKNDLR